MRSASPVILSLAALLLFAGCADRQMETRTTSWPDGSLKEEWRLQQQQDGSFLREGPYRSWYESGRKNEEGAFNGDLQTGTWRTWYDVEPQTRISEGAYVDGEKDGAWEYWMNPHHAHMMGQSGDEQSHHAHQVASATEDEDRPVKREQYRRGVPEGAWISWYPDGQIADSLGYKNGQLDGRVISYYPSGRPAAISEYRLGASLSGITMWDEKGAVLKPTP